MKRENREWMDRQEEQENDQIKPNRTEPKKPNESIRDETNEGKEKRKKHILYVKLHYTFLFTEIYHWHMYLWQRIYLIIIHNKGKQQI